MKKILTKIMPVVIIALTLCISIAMIAGCADKEIKFKGHLDDFVGGIPCDATLVLKDDKTCEYSVVLTTENEKFKAFEEVLKATGTWEMDGEQYKVTLTAAKEGSKSQTVTSTSSGSKFTIVYSMATEFGSKNIDLVFDKNA